MRWHYIRSILGMILCLFSMTMIPPIIVSFTFHEIVFMPFFYTFFICYMLGYVLWSSTSATQYTLRNVEGIMIVVLTWVALCAVSALPFIFGAIDVPVIDAVFEAVSGLTTTGTEILGSVEGLPKAVLYYHQQLEFVGGMGIIVLATSILPLLGVSGMEIYQAEIGGPVKDDKLLPRIRDNALLLWGLYIGLLVCCILGYHIGGLTWFDALCEAYGTISTGGFSIHDNSFAFYNSRFIECVCMIFMLLGGLNFSLHFMAIFRRSFRCYVENVESKYYLAAIGIMGCVVLLTLYGFDQVHDEIATLSTVAFTTISMMTTTGFTTSNFAAWPGCLPVLLMLLALIGGCAGSTTGGIKVLRLLLLYREGRAEFKRICHPRAVCSVHTAGDRIPQSMIDSIRGFIAVFLILYLLLLLLIMNTGLSFMDAFASVTACLSNAGASIGGVQSGFSHVPFSTKLILIVAMLAGRLEVMTLIIVCTPTYWRV
jgi:trk system potassium uptake protein TrkH